MSDDQTLGGALPGSHYLRADGSQAVTGSTTFQDDTAILLGTDDDARLDFDSAAGDVVFDYDINNLGTVNLLFQKNGSDVLQLRTDGTVGFFNDAAAPFITNKRDTPEFGVQPSGGNNTATITAYPSGNGDIGQLAAGNDSDLSNVSLFVISANNSEAQFFPFDEGSPGTSIASARFTNSFDFVQFDAPIRLRDGSELSNEKTTAQLIHKPHVSTAQVATIFSFPTVGDTKADFIAANQDDVSNFSGGVIRASGSDVQVFPFDQGSPATSITTYRLDDFTDVRIQPGSANTDSFILEDDSGNEDVIYNTGGTLTLSDDIGLLLGTGGDARLDFDSASGNVIFDYDVQNAGTTQLEFQQNGTTVLRLNNSGQATMLSPNSSAFFTVGQTAIAAILDGVDPSSGESGLASRNKNQNAETYLPFNNGNIYLTGDADLGTGDIILRSDNGASLTTHVTIRQSDSSAEFNGRIFHKNGFTSRTLSGNLTLATTDEEIQLIDPGGSGRDVTLPAEGSSTGLKFFIKNTADAAEALTVKDDGGNTIAAVGQNEATMVVCDGSSWITLGVWNITQS